VTGIEDRQGSFRTARGAVAGRADQLQRDHRIDAGGERGRDQDHLLSREDAAKQ
jgi:hypothetical protein